MFARLSSLESLDINHLTTRSRVTTEGVRKLKTLTKLNQLSIEMTDLPDGFEKEMTIALPNCKFFLNGQKPERLRGTEAK